MSSERVTNSDINDGISVIKRIETLAWGIVTAVMLWIGNSVSDLRIQMTGMERDVAHIKNAQATEIDNLERHIAEIDYNLSTVWPRLRNTQADVKVLWRVVEELAKKDIGEPATGTFTDQGLKRNGT